MERDNTKLRPSFTEAANHLIKWLNENVHPHHTAIVTPDGAELVEGRIGHKTDEFIKN